MLSGSFIQGLWMFLHIVGFGAVFAGMLAGPMLERQFQGSTDWNSRAKIGMVLMRLSLVGRLAMLLLLVSGIGNMVNYGFTMANAFSGDAWWLGVKIVLWAVMLANGQIFAMKMQHVRGGILQKVLAGNVPPDAEAALKSTYGGANMYFRMQGFFLLVIVVMAIFRP